MQRLGVVPDKIVHLNIRQQQSLRRIEEKANQVSADLYGEPIIKLARELYAEYEMNVNAVRDSFKQFIYEYDADERTNDQ